ncbi:MAGa3780 family membrane protein [Candidatus Mycoplasma pogonae]
MIKKFKEQFLTSNWKKNPQFWVLTAGIIMSILMFIFIVTEMVLGSGSVRKAKAGEENKVEEYLRMDAVLKQAAPLFYFTNQTNVFLAVTLVLLGIFWHHQTKAAKMRELLFVAVILMTITTIIYWSLISYTRKWDFTTYSSFHSAMRSIFTHLIHFVVGVTVLIYVRKDVVIGKKALLVSAGYVMGYFFFALILFFASKAANGKPAVIYSFLNFEKPLFYKKGNLGAVVVLDILMFVIAAVIPWLFVWLYKVILKVKINLPLLDKLVAKCKLKKAHK